MDPLSAYLLSVLKNEGSCDTRRYIKHEQALVEMGYWLLMRPSTHARDQMPPTSISQECRLVDEFRSYMPPIGLGCGGFYTIVEVYAEPILSQWGGQPNGEE